LDYALYLTGRLDPLHPFHPFFNPLEAFNIQISA
jgi:hypothetical protein